MPFDLQTFAQVAAGGILNSLLAGLAIAFLASVVARLVGRRGSGTRFAVWFCGLAAIGILPWFSEFGASRSHALSGVSRSAVTLPASFASYLFIAWIIGAAFGLLRVGFSLIRLHELRSTCTAVDLSQLGASLQASLSESQGRRNVTLCSSDAVRVPAALGYFRPIVVFPTWALQEIPAAELEAILLHELAHLRRWDDWTNLAQKILKAVLFFHPAVWFIESRLTLEREMACDDAVLAANFSPRVYAGSLLALAEKSFLRRGVHLAQAAVSHVWQLKTRLVAILRKDREGSGRVWKPAIALMVVVGVVSMYCVSRGPQLFAFSGGGTQVASSAVSGNLDSLPDTAALRPVNLSLVAPATELSRIRNATQPIRLRIVRPVPPKPFVASAQRRVPQPLFEDELTASAMLVPANLTTTQSGMTPSAVLVVMQTEQFGNDGPVFWRLTIVHLTPAQQRAMAGGAPKQI